MSEAYLRAIAGEALPCAFVDLDAVDANVRTLLGSHQHPVRLATKSIRVPELLRYIIKRGEGRIRGLMAYSVREAAYLVTQGFDDILVAYPTVQRADLDALTPQMAVVIDSAEHIEALRGTRTRVIVDVDVSWRLFGAHVGVRRSPLHAVDAVAALVDRATDAGLQFAGLMAYEAHLAGLGDSRLPVRLMKRAARGALRDFRRALAERIRPPLFNGAGTGSLHTAGAEPWLTELTAGSGFLCSHLFDHYAGVPLRPAVFFAVQVARQPAPGIVTVHSGGYIASGQAGASRLPQPYFPKRLALLPLEGVGEVQTPLRTQQPLAVGSAVIFRHAKAGELAEHFNAYALLRGDRIERHAKTYRGHGLAAL